VIDWGVYETVDFLLQGKSHMHGCYPLLIQPIPDPATRREIDAMIADPDALFVDHVTALEAFPGVGARLETIARSEGYEKVSVRTVADRNGRPVFEIFSLQTASAGSPNATNFRTPPPRL
jgi:hypothetical protein